jgi:hypothetical protein
MNQLRRDQQLQGMLSQALLRATQCQVDTLDLARKPRCCNLIALSGAAAPIMVHLVHLEDWQPLQSALITEYGESLTLLLKQPGHVQSTLTKQA